MNTGDFRLLYYFIEIVDAGSIRGAAKKLGLSPAVVSSALADLEEAVSATVISRTTRTMKLTDAGRSIYNTARIATEAVDEAMQAPGRDTARIGGRVSVTLPTELASTWLPPLLTKFKRMHPGVETAIHADDAAVDLTGSEHDISLRTEFQASPRSGADVVAVYPLDLVCSAGLADSLPKGSLQKCLDKIPFIGSDHQTKDGTLFARNTRTGRETVLRIRPGFTITNRQVALELARQGFGVALLISISTEDDIRNGALKRLGETHGFGHVVVRVMMRDRLPSPAAKAMRDLFLADGQLT